MQSILAGSTTDWRWDRDKDNGTETDDDGKETPKPRGGYVSAQLFFDGPIFTIQTMDYWQAQDVLDESVPKVKRIRKALEVGLVSIDGSKEQAAAFLAKPKPRLVNPLFDLILEMASGN
jgi:hypothetical protein